MIPIPQKHSRCFGVFKKIIEFVFSSQGDENLLGVFCIHERKK